MPLQIDGLEPGQFEEVERPGDSTSGDYCSVCGVPLVYGGRGKHPTKCEQHKTTKTTKTGSGGGKGGATLTEWVRFNNVALLALTWLIGRFAAGGQGLFLKPPNGITEAQFEATTDYLSMTEDEAAPIASLLAKRIVPTKLNQKVGRHIVASLEYEDIGFALWDYSKRVGPVLSARLTVKKGQPTPIPQVPSQATTPDVGRPGKVTQLRGRSNTNVTARQAPQQLKPSDVVAAARAAATRQAGPPVNP